LHLLGRALQCEWGRDHSWGCHFAILSSRAVGPALPSFFQALRLLGCFAYYFFRVEAVHATGDYPPDAVQLLSGQTETEIPVPKFKDVTTIPPTPLIFAALKKGNVTVKAVFVNRKGHEAENSKVIAINSISSSGPSDLDYSGTWNLDIQFRGKAYHGQLCMDDKSEGLSGSYSLVNGGERGNINGSHDGKRYWASLKPSGTSSS
jgi:hypothetical protein